LSTLRYSATWTVVKRFSCILALAMTISDNFVHPYTSVIFISQAVIGAIDGA